MIAGYDVTRVLYILTIPGRMSLCVPMNNYIGRLLSSLPGRGEVRDMAVKILPSAADSEILYNID